LILILSTGAGTRKERMNDKYYLGIKENDTALFIKLCDRLSNTRSCIANEKDDLLKMYQKEYLHFKEMLYTDRFKPMWDELDELTQLGNIVYYEGIDKFNEDNLYKIYLPNPIPKKMYRELYQKGILSKNKLEVGKYYLGNVEMLRLPVGMVMYFPI